MDDLELPRLAEEGLSVALGDTPVVLVHGPRQCGKTTLARRVGRRLGHEYFSFDEDAVRLAAQRDPAGFVARLPRRVVLDEVQRVPEIFLPIKVEVDRGRVPGRFLLTGSTDILLLPGLSDSLAGRIGVLRLHPFAQCEIERKAPTLLKAIRSGDFGLQRGERLEAELARRIVAGGFPAAVARGTPGRRRQWYENYVESLVQRDARELARISSLRALPKLLRLCAAQTGRLINISDLSSSFQLSRPTIRDYVTLLERLFLVEELPPWSSNRLSRLVKTPKLHLADTGLACALLSVTQAGLLENRELLGQLLETFVYTELRRQSSGLAETIEFAHFRDKDGAEVDLVLQFEDSKVAGVEVKASATLRSTDFRGLRRLRESCGRRFAGGVILYDGDATVGMGDGLFAVPISELWR